MLKLYYTVTDRHYNTLLPHLAELMRRKNNTDSTHIIHCAIVIVVTVFICTCFLFRTVNLLFSYLATQPQVCNTRKPSYR